MIKVFLGALAISALVASSPAAAQSTDKTAPPAATKNSDQTSSTDCTEGNMAKGHSMMMGMPDGEKKNMAMKEMGMAKEMMEKKDMASCKDHMTKGMGMGMGMAK